MCWALLLLLKNVVHSFLCLLTFSVDFRILENPTQDDTKKCTLQWLRNDDTQMRDKIKSLRLLGIQMRKHYSTPLSLPAITLAIYVVGVV